MSVGPSPKDYVAQPPDPKFSFKDFWLGFRKSVKEVLQIIKDTVSQTEGRPDPFKDPPDPPSNLDPKVVEQCIKMYDRAEEARKGIEEKAKTLFTIISFLAPLVAAGMVYTLGHPSVHGVWRPFALGLLIAVAVLLALAFVWSAKVVHVKEYQSLGISSVIENDQFRTYDDGFYVQGLLYCTSWNDAMNALIVRFLYNAQVLIRVAVFFGLIASIPVGMVYAKSTKDDEAKQASEQQQLVLKQIANSLNDGVRVIHIDLQKLDENSADKQEIASLQSRLEEVESRLAAQAVHAKVTVLHRKVTKKVIATQCIGKSAS